MRTTTTAGPGGLYFLRRFLRNPRHVGAICPSTRSLGLAMVRDLELRPGDVVLEYGPGTGSLTYAIREHLRGVDGVRYLGIEREAGFCSILRERFPEFDFAHADVEDVERLLSERRLGRPKSIISGLPLIFLPAMEQIVSTAQAVLADGGSFRTFSYVQSYLTGGARRLRALMRGTFDHFEMSAPVFRNFPPALVLRGDRRGPPKPRTGVRLGSWAADGCERS